MTGLLSSCLIQVNQLYKYFVSIRFKENKWTAGKLNFFRNLCEKLKHDIGEFAEILAPTRKGFVCKIILLSKNFILVLVQEGIDIIEKVLHQ